MHRSTATPTGVERRVGAVEHVDQTGERPPGVATGEVGRQSQGGRAGRIAVHVASSK